MSEAESDGIVPDWPASANVRAFQTTVVSGLPPGLPSEPCWLEQVHGATVVSPGPGQQGSRADAAVALTAGVVLVVKTADCLPVLLCERSGRGIGAVHAGWRGLAAGVIEAAVAALPFEPGSLLAWLGPCIGQDAFEIGPEVRDALLAADPCAEAAFRAGHGDRWHADLAALACRRLAAAGVASVHGGGWCTFSDPARFHSYRRDGTTDRMVSLIWTC